MPFESIILKGMQGDEKELEQRIADFLNAEPAKKIQFITTWTIGIDVYLLVLFSKGKPEDIDYYVSLWHCGNSTLPLHEFLGITKDEYVQWVLDDSCLKDIVETHRQQSK